MAAGTLTADYWETRLAEVRKDLEAARSSKEGKGKQQDVEALAAYVSWLEGKKLKAEDRATRTGVVPNKRRFFTFKKKGENKP